MQSAQSIALENGNQQIEQVHLLGVLLIEGFLERKQGFIDRDGGRDLLELTNAVAIVSVDKVKLGDVLRDIVLRGLEGKGS